MMAELRIDEGNERDKAAAAELWSEATAGDRDARDTLARWCLPRVRRTVALAYGGGPERDDLVQIAMARIFAKLESFRGDASFWIWVDRIAINTVHDHYRGRRFPMLWSSETDADAHQQADDETPDRQLERQRLLDRLADHFARLRPKLRYPLILQLAHGYTVPEVAAMLGIGFPTAQKRLYRGRRQLLARVKKDRYCTELLCEMKR